jgi:hypothetical protein
LYEARPLALSPPAGFLPSLRCHAAVLGINPLSLNLCTCSRPPLRVAASG